MGDHERSEITEYEHVQTSDEAEIRDLELADERAETVRGGSASKNEIAIESVVVAHEGVARK